MPPVSKAMLLLKISIKYPHVTHWSETLTSFITAEKCPVSNNSRLEVDITADILSIALESSSDVSFAVLYCSMYLLELVWHLNGVSFYFFRFVFVSLPCNIRNSLIFSILTISESLATFRHIIFNSDLDFIS